MPIFDPDFDLRSSTFLKYWEEDSFNEPDWLNSDIIKIFGVV